MTLVERLREQIQNIRRKSTPLSDLIPMLSEAADQLEFMEKNYNQQVMVSCVCSHKTCTKTEDLPKIIIRIDDGEIFINKDGMYVNKILQEQFPDNLHHEWSYERLMETGKFKVDTPLSPEHERYAWLRDGKSHYGGRGGSAPFVMSPNRSRLYAIHRLRAEALDAEIDADILSTKAQKLHEHNEVVERGLMVRPDRDSDEYADVLYKLAQTELGWTDVRTKIAKDFK